jgi:hypothetical protein
MSRSPALTTTSASVWTAYSFPRGQSSDALIHDVLDVAIEISGANKGMLQRYDEVNDCLRIVASRGFPGLRSEPF